MRPKLLLTQIAASALILICSQCSKEIEVDNFFHDGEVEVVFENDKANGINVIFLGDGYLKLDLDKDRGNYRKNGLSCINAIFDSPPFSEYKNYFNAYIVYVESEETGTETTKRTKFGGTWLPIGIGGRSLLTITNETAAYLWATKVPGVLYTNGVLLGKNLILVSVNGSDGGSAYLKSDLAVFGNLGSTTVAVHEVGHAFAGLGDEYVLGNNIDYNVSSIPNLDTTNDLGKVKWHHFIDLNDPIYNGIGAFEGGGYNQFGIWRPDENSIMRSRDGNSFNAPGREAIVKRIMDIQGIPFDFKAFLGVDKVSASRIRSLYGRVDTIDQSRRLFVDQPSCFPY